MVKKICPVCDLPVNGANYCPRCRQVVKKPVNWDVNYSLNENNSQAPLAVSQPPIAKTPVNRPAVNAPLHGMEGSNILLFLVIATFVVVILAGVIISCAANATALEDKYETTAEYDENGYDSNGYKALDEADVIAAGERCSGFEHFETDGKEIYTLMAAFLEKEQYGYRISSQENYWDNYELNQDTYYETVKSIYLKPAPEVEGEDTGDGDYEYVDINYDTATGELHRYVSYLKDPEATLAYLEQFLLYTEAGCNIEAEPSRVAPIMEQIRARLYQHEGAYIMEGIFDVTLIVYDDRLQVYVSYNNPEYVEKQET